LPSPRRPLAIPSPHYTSHTTPRRGVASQLTRLKREALKPSDIRSPPSPNQPLGEGLHLSCVNAQWLADLPSLSYP
ncbi:MAG: hypothetical protein K2M88_03845, partial [Muribaculaceae bacterium]|nr:hypothetical protein [Muribaculaceae bacterium]